MRGGDGVELLKDSRGRVGYKPKRGENSLPERLKVVKEKPYLATVGLLGVFLILVAVVSAGMIANKATESGVEMVIVDEEGGEIFVDVGGAVIQPGLYQLSGEGRVNDALAAAGGLAAEADRDWFEKNINLAQKVSDGDKIYIPVKGETEPVSQSSSGEVAGSSLTEKININTASVAELDTLWGVGPATAEKIISNRPYASVEELQTKKAVNNNVYERIKDEVTVY